MLIFLWYMAEFLGAFGSTIKAPTCTGSYAEVGYAFRDRDPNQSAAYATQLAKCDALDDALRQCYARRRSHVYVWWYIGGCNDTSCAVAACVDCMESE